MSHLVKSEPGVTHPDCVNDYCHPDRQHLPCSYCFARTCGRGMRVDPRTLRRRLVPRCDNCSWQWHPEDEPARTARTQKDWLEITDPLRLDVLRLGEMPEQFPSDVRIALRAFYESREPTAVVDLTTVTPASLNQAIANLGLTDYMYAEQRSHQVVLRRLKPTTQAASADAAAK